MTMNGADGTTLEDMRTTLGYSDYSIGAVNRCFGSLMDILAHLDPEVQFEVANAIWCQEGVPFEQPFLDACEQFYDAEAANLDFDRPDAPEVVNTWVSDKTHGKITEIVDRFEPLTKICLVNAIYFLGAWREALDPEKTFDAPFMLPDSTWRQVRMMVGPDSCNHYTAFSGPGFRALDMAYGDSVFSMTLFVPSDGNTIASMLEDFSQPNWTAWMMGFRPWCGDLMLPRFEVEYGVRMKDVLTALGMGIIFEPGRADFTRMCTYYDDFYIKKVMHKTYMRVDERGTEAAAVTEVEGGPTSIPLQFFVHSPFVFAIRENRFNTVIFIGQITDPGYFID
jgi:serpin B